MVAALPFPAAEELPPRGKIAKPQDYAKSTRCHPAPRGVGAGRWGVPVRVSPPQACTFLPPWPRSWEELNRLEAGGHSGQARPLHTLPQRPGVGWGVCVGGCLVLPSRGRQGQPGCHPAPLWVCTQLGQGLRGLPWVSGGPLTHRLP